MCMPICSIMSKKQTGLIDRPTRRHLILTTFLLQSKFPTSRNITFSIALPYFSPTTSAQAKLTFYITSTIYNFLSPLILHPHPQHQQQQAHQPHQHSLTTHPQHIYIMPSLTSKTEPLTLLKILLGLATLTALIRSFSNNMSLPDQLRWKLRFRHARMRELMVVVGELAERRREREV